MKGFFYGLTAGLAAGVAAQMMIAKNHEQMLELVKSIPRPLKFAPGDSVEELLAQKQKLEEMIQKKEEEAAAAFQDVETTAVPEEDDDKDKDEVEGV